MSEQANMPICFCLLLRGNGKITYETKSELVVLKSYKLGRWRILEPYHKVLDKDNICMFLKKTYSPRAFSPPGPVTIPLERKTKRKKIFNSFQNQGINSLSTFLICASTVLASTVWETHVEKMILRTLAVNKLMS